MDHTTNPQFANLRRVENGWILTTSSDPCYRAPEFIFPEAKDLADFIRQNFRKPAPPSGAKKAQQ